MKTPILIKISLVSMVTSLPALRVSQLAHHVLAKTVDRAPSRERDQRHLAGLAGLEPHRGSGRDVEPHAARLLALELQRRIGLEEMIMAADLDRAVTRIGDRERHGLAVNVEYDVARFGDDFAGDHGGESFKGASSRPRQARPRRIVLDGSASSD